MRRTLLLSTAHRHRHRRETGFTLVETLVSILLMAVVVMSIFSMALTSRMSSKKTSRKMAANIYTKTVEEKLKAYVTGDTSATTSGLNATWTIPGDTCAGCANAPNCFALQTGCTHDVTSMLPVACTPNQPMCSGPPANATLTYTVINQGGCVGAGCRKKVVVSIDWTE